MFIKPYRHLLFDNSIKSHEAWLQKDMEAAPQELLQSFVSHVEAIKSDTIQYFVRTVLKQMVSGVKHTDVSLQFSGTQEFILRDLAFGETIVKSLLAKKLDKEINEYINIFFDRLDTVDYFLNGTHNRDFNKNYMRYHKSFVVGLKPQATSIDDIEYVDVFFDDKHDAIPTNKKLSLCPECVTRKGIALRFYLQSSAASFRTKTETVNCSSVGDGSQYNTITDVSGFNSTYILTSTEYYFDMDINDMDNVMISYIEDHKDLLSNRLGYMPDIIDKDILKVIDMVVI